MSTAFLPLAIVSLAVLFSGCPPWLENEDKANVPSPQGHVLDDTTVALWRLNETSASDNAVDATGSYPLQQYGNPDVVAGHAWNGRGFDGSTKFFQLPGDLAMGTAMNGDWTFEGWVYLDNTFSANAILYIYNGLNFSGAPQDTILAEVGVNPSKKVYWNQWHTSSGSDLTQGVSGAALQTGRYYHVAVSRAAEGGNLFTFKIYIDGALDNTTTGVSGHSSPGTVTGASHYIGLGCYTGASGLGNGGSPLNGRLDDVRISKVARSAAEILHSYQR